MQWLLLLVLSFYSAAETSGSPMERAQALAVKKNRVEACAVIRRAWEEAAPNTKARAKWGDFLDQVSRMFFTDKGQKSFESGQAIMWDNPDLAMVQFNEAMILEDQNIQLLNNIARVQMIKQDCDGALSTLRNARTLNPHLGESAVLELRALTCKQNFEVLRQKLRELPTLSKWEETYVQYLTAGELIQQKSLKKALDILSKVVNEQPQFPEAFYLAGKVANELGKDDEIYFQKYVSLCKAITSRERKRFSLEPRLCSAIKEAEDELAKKKASF